MCLAANWYVNNLVYLFLSWVFFSENVWFYFQRLAYYCMFLGPGTIRDSQPFLCLKWSQDNLASQVSDSWTTCLRVQIYLCLLPTQKAAACAFSAALLIGSPSCAEYLSMSFISVSFFSILVTHFRCCRLYTSLFCVYSTYCTVGVIFSYVITSQMRCKTFWGYI